MIGIFEPRNVKNHLINNDYTFDATNGFTILRWLCFRVSCLMATQAAKSPQSIYDNYDHIGETPIVSKLNAPLAPKIRAYIEECVRLCKPEVVYICDGSETENVNMLKLLQKTGTVEPLPKYNNWWAILYFVELSSTILKILSNLYWGNQFDQDPDVSDLPRNFLYESTCRKTHTLFFFNSFLLLFVFEISFFFSNKKINKNHHFLKSEKIYINLIKYIKIFEPY